MKIAVIGAGISGLSAAHLLHSQHEISIYERADEAGGHARTVDIDTPEGDIPVDTGFIVFNHRNYPRLSAMFDALEIPLSPCSMSFGVSIADGWLEYGTRSLGGLLAQPANLAKPEFLKMIADIVRFNRRARRYLEGGTQMTVGQLIATLDPGDWFARYYLLAMAAAIWSAPLPKMPDFPALRLLRFFDNHGLLQILGQPQWHSIIGGSRVYVDRLCRPFKDRIWCAREAVKIRRDAQGADSQGVEVIDRDGARATYDQLIFACPADIALQLLDPPTDQEARLLRRFAFQENSVILHEDARLMPKRRRAWASWNYRSATALDAKPAISLTYWMNSLQRLSTSRQIFVTVNPDPMPDPGLVHDIHRFRHPLYDHEAFAAQDGLSRIQGQGGIWYCGAWLGYGFHEDGVRSAEIVADALNARRTT